MQELAYSSLALRYIYSTRDKERGDEPGSAWGLLRGAL